MEIFEFAVDYPELFSMFREDVRYVIAEKKITVEVPLVFLDNMIDNLVRSYEQEEYYGYDAMVVPAQQVNFNAGFRGGDRDRDERGRRRRRFRDFDTRDILRILFFRELFDKDRR